MLKKIIYSFAIITSLAVGASPVYAQVPTLTCSPSNSSVLPAQQITFTATGGTGTYTWSAPNMTPQSGPQLTVYYPIPGTSTVTVTSGTQTAVCTVTILGATTPTPTPTPGLPPSGAGGVFGAMIASLSMIVTASLLATILLKKKVV